MTGLTANETRLIKLALGIVSMEQTIKANSAPPETIEMMKSRRVKSLAEYNSIMVKIDFNSLIKKLEAIE